MAAEKIDEARLEFWITLLSYWRVGHKTGDRRMKTILVPTEPHESIRSVLETALLAAGKFAARIEGFALRPAIGNLVTMDPVNSLTVVSLRDNDMEIIKEARGIFESFMRVKQVPFSDGAGTSVSCAWFDGAPGEDFVGNYGRVFDLIVLGRPAKSRQGPRMTTLESALFESGRPLLLAPPAPPRSLGDKILIAWNCSTEQARATALAMPLLRKAGLVIICTVEGATVPGPTGEQMARNLLMNGIRAESVSVAPGQRRAGEVMLAQAEALGCDLIVKGAYTQSRLRQMIFGGTTQHILTHATVPVLLAH
jgi:nucleotide-binding universal stress UspA family protein